MSFCCISSYRGTFVFLNPRAKTRRLSAEQVNALGGAIIAKKDDTGPDVPGTGTIEVFSANSGVVYLDDQAPDSMISGETRQFFRQTPGTHRVQFREARGGAETKEVQVEVGGGAISYVGFSVKSPIDHIDGVPVGTLQVFSRHGLSGEVFVDNFSVGRLEQGGMLTVDHLTTGPHICRIVGTGQTQSLPMEIKPNQTTYIAPRPSPPTGLTATVH